MLRGRYRLEIRLSIPNRLARESATTVLANLLNIDHVPELQQALKKEGHRRKGVDALHAPGNLQGLHLQYSRSVPFTLARYGLCLHRHGGVTYQSTRISRSTIWARVCRMASTKGWRVPSFTGDHILFGLVPGLNCRAPVPRYCTFA